VKCISRAIVSIIEESISIGRIVSIGFCFSLEVTEDFFSVLEEQKEKRKSESKIKSLKGMNEYTKKQSWLKTNHTLVL
jgi:hypothetical protein